MQDFDVAAEMKTQLARDLKAALMTLENEIDWLKTNLRDVERSLEAAKNGGYFSQDLNIAGRAAAVQAASARVEEIKKQQDYLNALLTWQRDQAAQSSGPTK